MSGTHDPSSVPLPQGSPQQTPSSTANTMHEEEVTEQGTNTVTPSPATRTATISTQSSDRFPLTADSPPPRVSNTETIEADILAQRLRVQRLEQDIKELKDVVANLLRSGGFQRKPRREGTTPQPAPPSVEAESTSSRPRPENTTQTPPTQPSTQQARVERELTQSAPRPRSRHEVYVARISGPSPPFADSVRERFRSTPADLDRNSFLPATTFHGYRAQRPPMPFGSTGSTSTPPAASRADRVANAASALPTDPRREAEGALPSPWIHRGTSLGSLGSLLEDIIHPYSRRATLARRRSQIRANSQRNAQTVPGAGASTPTSQGHLPGRSDPQPSSSGAEAPGRRVGRQLFPRKALSGSDSEDGDEGVMPGSWNSLRGGGGGGVASGFVGDDKDARELTEEEIARLSEPETPWAVSQQQGEVLGTLDHQPRRSFEPCGEREKDELVPREKSSDTKLDSDATEHSTQSNAWPRLRGGGGGETSAPASDADDEDDAQELADSDIETWWDDAYFEALPSSSKQAPQVNSDPSTAEHARVTQAERNQAAGYWLTKATVSNGLDVKDALPMYQRYICGEKDHKIPAILRDIQEAADFAYAKSLQVIEDSQEIDDDVELPNRMDMQWGSTFILQYERRRMQYPIATRPPRWSNLRKNKPIWVGDVVFNDVGDFVAERPASVAMAEEEVSKGGVAAAQTWRGKGKQAVREGDTEERHVMFEPADLKRKQRMREAAEKGRVFDEELVQKGTMAEGAEYSAVRQTVDEAANGQDLVETILQQLLLRKDEQLQIAAEKRGSKGKGRATDASNAQPLQGSFRSFSTKEEARQEAQRLAQTTTDPYQSTQELLDHQEELFASMKVQLAENERLKAARDRHREAASALENDAGKMEAYGRTDADHEHA